mmetsp:Transcript_12914/g.16049  ORF Transcript_12914/g.16049 Transcript_12914/m.16049 type:complete len:260 (-) Transcript_12914:2376-3155(-)|eukprot:CAMPEP_0204862194 /NCGR_PEP_ID=MMETSP1348-20121228/2275_1 /ASSEMBLY_ACC=CAM_ASM_000700 /TAXON_ID=215587 /ORGANISM="Aplanochytrium stocchinoi, Strain GSBS06" /LENGTH=259 /DNA_ID=CAMNT_0052011995 /DNA_START=19 /DNA_END=798 /DNA_ORIENTATION=+
MTRKAKTLIILLGWWKCQPKHLQKYSDLYARLGYETYSYVATSKVLLGGPVIQHVAAVSLMKKIDQKLVEEGCSRVVFHSFSNNGCLMYLACQRVLRSHGYKWKYIGSIFDSCPGSFEAGVPFLALLEAYPDQPMKSLAQFSVGAPMLIAVAYIMQQKHPWLRALQILGGYKLTSGIINFFYHKGMRTVSQKCPQLYLYSKEDKLVRHEVVTKVADAESARGIKVTKQEFIGSKHVAHLQSHPVLYEQTIDSFLNDTLE